MGSSRTASALVLVAGLGLGAMSTTVAMAQQSGDRAFQITPYVWATGLGADLRFGAFSVDVDKSFSDVLKDLDGAFFLSALARQDRLVLLGDLSWSSSSRAGILPPPAPGPLPAEGRLRQTSLTLAAGYRVAAMPGATVDLLAGLRHWRISTSGSVPLAGLAASRSASFTDPIIAARINVEIAPSWFSLLYADVGGFGVGSEFTGQFLATVNYAVSDSTFLSFGYRHLMVDYRSGAFRVDGRMSGPLVGATLRF